jgi:hypothetical protein
VQYERHGEKRRVERQQKLGEQVGERNKETRTNSAVLFIKISRPKPQSHVVLHADATMDPKQNTNRQKDKNKRKWPKSE